MLTLVAAGFTACDGKDEPGYSAATRPAEEQRVFFTASSMTENIDPESDSFDVMLYRPQDENAPELTVQLLASCVEEGVLGTIIKVPAYATFAAGSPNAPISIVYDAAGMKGNHPYPVSITVDEANADEYGIRTITVNLNRSEYTDWAPFGYDEALGRTGTGTYTFTQFYSGSDNVMVLERHVPDDPNDIEFQFQWLIDNDQPELGYETFMTAYTKDGGKTVRVPEQKFADHPSYGDVLVADTYTYTGSASYNGLSFFDGMTGQFTLNLVYYCSAGVFANGDEFLNLIGYMDTNEYSVALSDVGQVKIDGKDYAVINFNMTEAVAYVDYTVVEGALDEEAAAAVAEKMQDPAQELYKIEKLEKSGNVTFNFSKPGDFTVVAVAYKVGNDGVAEAKSSASLSFAYDTFNPYAGWVKVTDDAVYVDNFIAGIYGAPDFANYEEIVEINKSEEFEGLYRIVNPFAEFAQYGLSVADFGSLEFDLSDPDHVYFPASECGLLEGNDPIEIMSFAYYSILNGEEIENIPARYWATFKDNKLSFPAVGAERDANFLMAIGEDIYYCDADFTLEFDASAPAAKPAKSVKRLANAISRHLAAAKGCKLAPKAYFNVKDFKACPFERSASSAKAQRRIIQ